MPVIKAGKSRASLQEQSVSPDTIQLDENLGIGTENKESDVKSSVTKSSKRRAEHKIFSKKHAVLVRWLHVLKEIMQP